jgi:MinD superfamily P-loop ATPase
LCPEDAISEKKRELGVLEKGRAGEIKFAQGKLKIGEPMPVPVIRAVKRMIDPESITIVDVPPGTSCPVIEAVLGSDFCILVTEPTPFGLNDLKLAVELLKKLKIKFGVVINRDGIGDDKVEEYCQKENISVMARIPYDREVAVLYSYGIPFLIDKGKYRETLEKLRNSIQMKTRR